MTGTKLVHVPYRSPPQAMTDLLSGQVQVMFDVMNARIAAHQRGPAARARRHHRDALRPRYPDVPNDRRHRAGLRGQFVERHLRAGRRASGDRRRAQ